MAFIKWTCLQVLRRLRTQPNPQPTKNLSRPMQDTKEKEKAAIKRSARVKTATEISKKFAQDKSFAVGVGKSWKDTFSKQFPQDRPILDRKIKICTGWHIKGDCYDNCARAAIHVAKNKFPGKKKESFLTFMLKCCEAAKKGHWLLGLGPSSVWLPKKPSKIPLPFGFDTNSEIPNIHQRKPPSPPPAEEVSLPPRQDPPTLAPDSPSPWLLISTLVMSRPARAAATRATARGEHRLAMTKDQVNKMLGEYNDLPFLFPPDLKSNVHNAINNFLMTEHFDWPDNLIECIKQVVGTPAAPHQPQNSISNSQKREQSKI